MTLLPPFADLRLVCAAKMAAIAATHGFHMDDPMTADACSDPTACIAACVHFLGGKKVDGLD